MNLRILKSDLADLKNPAILKKYPHLAKDKDKRIAELEAIIKQEEEKNERLRDDEPKGRPASKISGLDPS